MSINASVRLAVLNSLFLSCLLSACGGTNTGELTPLETIEARKNGTKGASVTAPTASATVAPAPSSPSTGTLPDGSLAWSDTATWGGTLPPAGAEVVIPAGKVITLDTSPPNLAGLRVEGTLRFARSDIQLTAAYIDVTGAIEIGTAAAPFAQKAVITLNGAPQATNDGIARGLNVRGGRLEIYGAVPQPVWTKLNDHANAGATSLTLKESTNWRAGDTVAVAPTDFYGVAATERITVASASGSQLGLASPLAKFRWGKMQYVTSTGMSLAPDPAYVPPAAPAPTALDERAAIGNLTRNIVIQGADDAAWQTSGFGAHIMIMSLTSKVIVDGVEIRRAGQAGVMARYPFHWHMLSYAADGSVMGDAVGHVLRNSSIWNSSQRCVVIHGTNGVQVLNNICQDIKGHAFFLEDAVERRNVIDGNLALMTRSPAPAQLLQKHEGPDVFQGGPSGFWLTNPDNIVRNNHGGDAAGNGFWMAFPRRPLGLAASVPIIPDRTPHGAFENNTGHTARGPAILLEHAPVDAAGNVAPNMYNPSVDGSENGARVRFTLKRVTSFKNLEGAYRNRVNNADYQEWATADNPGPHFAGAGYNSVISRALVVGNSLNSATPLPLTYAGEYASAFATYHSTFSLIDNTIVNFPLVEGKASGAFKTDDYYHTGIDKGTARNRNNRLIASHSGFRSLPPNMDGQPLNNRNFTLSGALWDLHGYWGPKGNFHVFDVPFLTAGANCQWAAPAGKNGKTCDGEYYGVGNYKTDFDAEPYKFQSPIEAIRQDANGVEIGRWTVSDGLAGGFLTNMRHFAARNGGRYVLRFPGRPLPKSFAADISNAYRTNDSMVFAVSFDANVVPAGHYTSWPNREEPPSWPAGFRADYVRWLSPGSSLAEVIASPTGSVMWQDKVNNLVWIKVVGGLTAYTGEPNSDADLYRSLGLMLYPKP